MNIITSRKVPKVLKSTESIDEINSTAQKRLEARRVYNTDREKYLYGHPKELKPKIRQPFIIGTVNDKPHYVY